MGRAGGRGRWRGCRSSGAWFVLGFAGEAGGIYTADLLGLLKTGVKGAAAVGLSVNSG